jgi:hypothetical protein
MIEKRKGGRKTDKEIQQIKEREGREEAAKLLRRRAEVLRSLADTLEKESEAILAETGCGSEANGTSKAEGVE